MRLIELEIMHCCISFCKGNNIQKKIKIPSNTSTTEELYLFVYIFFLFSS